MKTYFVRHTRRLDISDSLRQQLWAERRIAIHYPESKNGSLLEADNESLNPADYSGKGKSAVGIFGFLAQDGGYVCAQYFGQSELLIGTVNPKSEITLLRGNWGSQSRLAVLKSLQLTDPATLQPRDHLLFAVCRPQQGTIAKWHAIGDSVAALLEKRLMPISWASLTPDQQEVACSEFLRLPDVVQFGLARLQSLLLPIGRTLNDVDIIGIAYDGKRLFAQVTYSKLQNIAWKREKLRNIVSLKDDHIILFCDCEKPSVEEGMHIFPVDEVFRIFNGLDWGRQFLRGAK